MLERAAATKIAVSHLAESDLALASLGNTKYDLMGAGDRPRNFYMWNSMGMASSMALGMAMAQPSLRVLLLQGDGDLLMNLNSLSTIAWRAPTNLVHVVWDNRQYEITGGQPTASSDKTNFMKMAEGAGYPYAEQVETEQAFAQACERAFTKEGPYLIHALCTAVRAPKTSRPPISPTFIKHRFMTALNVQH